MGMERWADFARFTRLALATGDVDPVYPVLKRVLELRGLDPASDDGLWLSVAHLTWYDIGSALRAWGAYRLAVDEPTVSLRCATERRGNRDPKQLKANLAGWRDAAEASGSLRAFLANGLPDDPKQAWQVAMDRIQLVHGNGRWASYKLAEILIRVNGFNLEPTHMGHANSSGPRRGLELLYDNLPTGNKPNDVWTLNAVSESVVEDLRAWNGFEHRMEEVETTLCDFHALVDGRYYVGNDIDQMLGQLLDQPSAHSDDALQARYDTLPHAYLGELGGWNRVDRERQRVYRDTGEILER